MLIMNVHYSTVAASPLYEESVQGTSSIRDTEDSPFCSGDVAFRPKYVSFQRKFHILENFCIMWIVGLNFAKFHCSKWEKSGIKHVSNICHSQVHVHMPSTIKSQKYKERVHDQ